MKYGVFIFSFFLLMIFQIKAMNKPFKIGYFKPFFGNIHKNLHIDSRILTTISCGQSLRIDLTFNNKKWYKVKSGPYLGYVKKFDVNFDYPLCFQDKYPKFFNKFNFSVEELYLWGKLNDRYVKDRVRFK